MSLNLINIFNIQSTHSINNRVFNGIYTLSSDFNINKYVNLCIKIENLL